MLRNTNGEKTTLSFPNIGSLPALSTFTPFDSKRNCPSVYMLQVSTAWYNRQETSIRYLFIKITSNNYQQQRSNTVISLCVLGSFFCPRRSCRFPVALRSNIWPYVLRLPKALHCRGGGLAQKVTSTATGASVGSVGARIGEHCTI